MNSPKLSRSLVLAALALTLNLTGRADDPTEQMLRDHVDAQVPAHLVIDAIHTRLIGNPAVKAKVELTLRAAETLYSETAKQPELKAVAAELTPDLRKQEPKALRTLKVVTPDGAVTKTLNFDFSVASSASGAVLGKIDGRKFVSFGQPRSEFAADSVAEDTLDGRAEIARWEKSVADYNLALKTHESRVRTDRNTGTLLGIVDQGVKVFDTVNGGHGDPATVVSETLGKATPAPAAAAPETKSATQEPLKAKSEGKDKVGETVKRLGGILGAFGAR